MTNNEASPAALDLFRAIDDADYYWQRSIALAAHGIDGRTRARNAAEVEPRKAEFMALLEQLPHDQLDAFLAYRKTRRTVKG